MSRNELRNSGMLAHTEVLIDLIVCLVSCCDRKRRTFGCTQVAPNRRSIYFTMLRRGEVPSPNRVPPSSAEWREMRRRKRHAQYSGIDNSVHSAVSRGASTQTAVAEQSMTTTTATATTTVVASTTTTSTITTSETTTTTTTNASTTTTVSVAAAPPAQTPTPAPPVKDPDPHMAAAAALDEQLDKLGVITVNVQGQVDSSDDDENNNNDNNDTFDHEPAEATSPKHEEPPPPGMNHHPPKTNAPHTHPSAPANSQTLTRSVISASWQPFRRLCRKRPRSVGASRRATCHAHQPHP